MSQPYGLSQNWLKHPDPPYPTSCWELPFAFWVDFTKVASVRGELPRGMVRPEMVSLDAVVKQIAAPFSLILSLVKVGVPITVVPAVEFPRKVKRSAADAEEERRRRSDRRGSRRRRETL